MFKVVYKEGDIVKAIKGELYPSTHGEQFIYLVSSELNYHINKDSIVLIKEEKTECD